MNIAVGLGGWCAVSVVVGLAFGWSVRSREQAVTPVTPPADAPAPAPASAARPAPGSGALVTAAGGYR